MNKELKIPHFLFYLKNLTTFALSIHVLCHPKKLYSVVIDKHFTSSQMDF